MGKLGLYCTQFDWLDNLVMSHNCFVLLLDMSLVIEVPGVWHILCINANPVVNLFYLSYCITMTTVCSKSLAANGP